MKNGISQSLIRNDRDIALAISVMLATRSRIYKITWSAALAAAYQDLGSKEALKLFSVFRPAGTDSSSHAWPEFACSICGPASGLRASIAAQGSRISNVEPPPGVLVKSIAPPCARRMP